MGYFKKYPVRLTISQWNWLKENKDRTGEVMNSFIRRAVQNQINNELQKDKGKDSTVSGNK